MFSLILTDPKQFQCRSLQDNRTSGPGGQAVNTRSNLGCGLIKIHDAIRPGKLRGLGRKIFILHLRLERSRLMPFQGVQNDILSHDRQAIVQLAGRLMGIDRRGCPSQHLSGIHAIGEGYDTDSGLFLIV